MKKIFLIGCIMLFVFCATKKTTVETEGLEEVIVFGEEEPTVIDEPVYPIEETAEPTEEIEESEAVTEFPPPIEEPIEESYVIEEPIEEPPSIIEEPVVLAPVEEPPPPVIEESYVPPTPPPTPPTKVFGFRIQIFASSTEENAAKVANDARAVFTESVYVDYVAPYYKVRLGDCLIQEDGEVLKDKAVRLGYRGAFIVETMIVP